MSDCCRALGAVALSAILLAALPARGEQDNPKPDPNKTGKPSSKTRFVGKLVEVDGTQHTLAVEVKQKIPQLNTQAAANIANSRQQLLTARDPNQIYNIRLDIAKNQQNLYTYKDEIQKIELEAVDDAKVRTMILPLAFDDKGKARKLTDKEKRNLRGPDLNVPGYTSDFDSLKPDQQVEIYLAKSRSTPPPAAKPKDRDGPTAKPKDKDGPVAKPKDKDGRDEPKRLKAAMIVILADTSK